MNHAVVWLDQSEAQILHFNAEAVEAEHLKSHPTHPHLKARAAVNGERENGPFFDEIAAVLADTPEILVVGPGGEKQRFVKHLERRHPAVAARVLGVETVDHPSGGQLLALARKHFHKIDLMR